MKRKHDENQKPWLQQTLTHRLAQTADLTLAARVDFNGLNALHYLGSDPDNIDKSFIVKRLLSAKADMHCARSRTSPLEYALRTDKTNYALCLIDHGAHAYTSEGFLTRPPGDKRAEWVFKLLEHGLYQNAPGFYGTAVALKCYADLYSIARAEFTEQVERFISTKVLAVVVTDYLFDFESNHDQHESSYYQQDQLPDTDCE